MADDTTLPQRYAQIRRKYAEYTEHSELKSDQDFVKAGLVWGVHQGNQTPSVLLIALEPGQVVLSGSFTRPMAVAAGDTITADYGPLGSVSCRFA